MSAFLKSSELWANIIGGVVAAILFAIITKLWNWKKHKTLQELIRIMGQAIKHRNIGKNKTFSNEEEWIQRAIKIEGEAVAYAKKLSPTAGSLVEWLDRVPPWSDTSEVEKYVSILDTVIERIRGLMEQNS